MTDTDAMNAIHSLLNAEEWSPDTLDDIADVVRATGREIEDIDDEDE